MPRQKQLPVDGFLPMEDDTSKIRKRGCSPTSSSSSIIQNYRFKRAVLVGRRGVGGSSSTPVPTWRNMASRSPSIALRVAAAAAAETPRSQSGKSTRGTAQPVSARKLAATLWEMNELSTPRTMIDGRGSGWKKGGGDGHMRREKLGKGGSNSLVSGVLPSHLSDPSHSQDQRSSTGNNRRQRQSSSGRTLSATALDRGAFDSASNASFMEIETRSRCHTPSGSTTTGGVRNNRLKDVSNALTTSKELLKIINRIRSQEDHHQHQSSSSTSLISALNTELERASLQVNHIIQEHRSDSSRSEISSLLKQFERERAVWKLKESEVVEAAIESIAGELEVERKLRRRVESLNKRLGKELAEMKESLLRAVEEVESEKRARGEMERVLAWKLGGGGDDLAGMEGSRNGVMRGREAAADERKKLHIFREERAWGMKHQSEAGDQIRNEHEEFRRTERNIEKANYRSTYDGTGGFEKEIGAAGDVESGIDDGEGSGESDLHSIELNRDGNGRRDYKLGGGHASSPRRPPKNCGRRLMMISEVEDVEGRKSFYSSNGGKDHYRGSGSSLLRSTSDVVGFGGSGHSQSSPHRSAAVDYEAPHQQHRRSCGDHDLQRYKSVKGLREQILSSYRNKDTASPARKWG